MISLDAAIDGKCRGGATKPPVPAPGLRRWDEAGLGRPENGSPVSKHRLGTGPPISGIGIRDFRKSRGDSPTGQMFKVAPAVFATASHRKLQVFGREPPSRSPRSCAREKLKELIPKSDRPSACCSPSFFGVTHPQGRQTAPWVRPVTGSLRYGGLLTAERRQPQLARLPLSDSSLSRSLQTKGCA
jgi:hypothetical protein